MSDVLSKILAGVLGAAQGGGMGGSMPGSGMPGGSGGSPLGDPRIRRVESEEAGRGGGMSMGQGGGGLGDILGGGMGGGLGSILGGLLGGMAGGGAPQQRGAPAGGGGLGGLLGGLGGMKGVALMALLAYMMKGQGGTQGLAALTDQLRGAGLDDRVNSWVGPGANQDVNPDELARAIPTEALDDVERYTGLGRDEVLSQLSRGLPGMVDRLTPRGQMPDNDDELNDIDEGDVLGSFGLGPVSGEAYGKHGPGQSGGRKS